MDNDHKHSSYLRSVFQGGHQSLKDVVDVATDELNRVDDDFTHIAVRGVSGTSVGGAVSYTTGKGLIVVRKTIGNSHAEMMVEGCPQNTSFNYVIVDDFMCSGQTIIEVVTEVLAANPYANCLGVYQYHEDYQSFIEWEKDNFSSFYKLYGSELFED